MPTVEKSNTISLRHRNVASVLVTGLTSSIYIQSNWTIGNMTGVTVMVKMVGNGEDGDGNDGDEEDRSN
jgi:hypothetical protein